MDYNNYEDGARQGTNSEGKYMNTHTKLLVMESYNIQERIR